MSKDDINYKASGGGSTLGASQVYNTSLYMYHTFTYARVVSYLSYLLHCYTLPNKRCLSHGMCLYHIRYQFFTRCEELVQIFHGVKFAKCAICGSTVLSCLFVTFAYGVLGQVWYLIVSIPDLCLHWNTLNWSV